MEKIISAIINNDMDTFRFMLVDTQVPEELQLPTDLLDIVSNYTEVEVFPQQNIFNITLLHIAAAYDRPEMVQFLLERGDDPNIVSDTLEVPLTLASSPRVVQLLLDYGADPTLRLRRGRRERLSILTHAIRTNNIPKILLLVEYGADINSVRFESVEQLQHIYDTFGVIPTGVYNLYHPDLIQFLLEHGLDPMEPVVVDDWNGMPLLEYAERKLRRNREQLNEMINSRFTYDDIEDTIQRFRQLEASFLLLDQYQKLKR